jgi:putative transposase
MKYNPSLHHRRSVRLKGHDYSSDGQYFITICTYQRLCLFGTVVDGVMHRNEYGEIIAEEWMKSREIRQEIEFGEWVVMPNHIHGIVIMNWAEFPFHVGAQGLAPLQHVTPSSTLPAELPSKPIPSQTGIAYRSPKSLSSFVAGFKMAATKRINNLRNAPGTPVWQRNYYENLIRNETSLTTIRHYILNNPQNWESDQLHPDVLSKWRRERFLF